MSEKHHPTHGELVQAAVAQLAAKGLIYDSGERRGGEIVWKIVPGKSLKDLDDQSCR